MVEKIQQAKIAAVSNLLKPLTAQEQQQLLSTLSKMAGQYSNTEVLEEYICRFCDVSECPLKVCQERLEAWEKKG